MIEALNKEIERLQSIIKKEVGVQESDTGLAPRQYWDLEDDKKRSRQQPLLVAYCTNIIEREPQNHYLIKVKNIAKYVVALGEKVSSVDIEEGMRVGVTRVAYSIEMPLPARIDATVSLMTVEERPDVTYDDVGGCKEQLEKLREVVELPMTDPELFNLVGD